MAQIVSVDFHGSGMPYLRRVQCRGYLRQFCHHFGDVEPVARVLNLEETLWSGNRFYANLRDVRYLVPCVQC
jgi:hypothetical protein